MTTLDAARELVSREGWMAEVPPDFRAAALERCQLQRFRAGSRIYSVGDEAGGIYGLVTGAVRVTIAPDGEGPFFAHLMRPGIWIGEGPALSGGRARLVGLSAGRDSELLHLPLPAIHALVDSRPSFWRSIGALALTNLQMSIGIINDLMIRDPGRRCVATLLRLGGCRYGSTPRALPIVLDLSQEDLAIMANLSRTTVGANLRRLAASGAIGLDYACVLLLDPERLRAMLSRDPAMTGR